MFNKKAKLIEQLDKLIKKYKKSHNYIKPYLLKENLREDLLYKRIVLDLTDLRERYKGGLNET